MFKKIISSILIAAFLLLNVGAPLAQAQDVSNWYDQGFDEWYSRVYDDNNPEEIFGERYTAAQVWWVIYGLAAFIINGMGDSAVFSCMLSNIDAPDDMETTCRPLLEAVITRATAHETTNQGFLATITNSPISSSAYFKYVANRINPVQEAHAQGFGFQQLNPVLALWIAVRNLTYFLLIIAVVIMAFMIMFRVKLSPQTVISVQSAIPKVFIALILITFSYAIAGFLVEFMYVVIGFIVSVVTATGTNFTNLNWTAMFNEFTTGNVLVFMFLYWIALIIVFIFAVFSTTSGAILGSIAVVLGAGSGAGIIIALILLIIILIVLLLLTFKIWFMLIKTFVNILLLTIIAPVQILLGVFGFGGFGPWLRNMMANLMVYPVVGVMFFAAFLFLAGGLPDSWPAWLQEIFTNQFPFAPRAEMLSGVGWRPPLTWGTADLDLLWVAVSVVIISLIPKTADMIKAMIQGKPFAYGTAIGEAVALGVPFAGSTAGSLGTGNYPWPLRNIGKTWQASGSRFAPPTTGIIQGGAEWIHKTGQQRRWWT